MKEYFDKWRQYVISEGHEEYAVNGVVKLYHYSPSMVARSVTLDPQRFVTSRRSWSRREYQTSTFPRIFFYLDKEKSEPGIGVGEPFVAEVDAMDIYDLLKDEEGLLKKSAQATGQTVPITRHPDTNIFINQSEKKVINSIKEYRILLVADQYQW
jgi:hypothetical protein